MSSISLYFSRTHHAKWFDLKTLFFYFYFIAAERIELWIHYALKGGASTPSSQTYEYLGFIALSDNTSTGCKSRELQSVPVGPKKGTHLKLRLGAAHKNDMNKFDQVRCVQRGWDE